LNFAHALNSAQTQFEFDWA